MLLLPPSELQQKVRPELEELVKKNRINCLLKGENFLIKTYRRQGRCGRGCECIRLVVMGA